MFIILVTIWQHLKMVHLVTFFLSERPANDLLAHSDEGQVVVGEDVVGLVDPRHLPESRPRELGLGRGEVDAVVDEAAVEVGLLFTRPASFKFGFLSVAFPKNLNKTMMT